MNKRIIEMADKVVANDNLTSFVATFDFGVNMEIVSVIGAWLMNSPNDSDYVARKIIEERMDNNPCVFVMSYKDDYWIDKSSLWENISEWNFTNLVLNLHQVYTLQGGLKNAYDLYMKSPRHKCKYAHDALSLVLGGNTCFPTMSNSGTFYRLNLIFYLLAYRFKLWDDVDIGKGLLPCNDRIFRRAYELGITKRKMKSTLRSVIILTQMAKDIFGEKDFFKLYELLNFNTDD